MGRHRFLSCVLLVLAVSILFTACDDDSTAQPVCGNGVMESGEECDGNDLPADINCLSARQRMGHVSCSAACTIDFSQCYGGTCGDGTAQPGLDECDGTDFAGQSCQSLGYYGGQLACRENCLFDVSDCESHGWCGDLQVQSDYEQCDGTDFAGQTCQTFGYGGGHLRCGQNCILDLSECTGFINCGDGTVQTPYEQCDGTNLAGQSCQSLGYHGGQLTCSDECRLDLTGCATHGMCGDGIMQGAYEQCDGTDFAGQSCQSLGYYGGQVTCSDECTIDTSTCEASGWCGDGIRQPQHEECDGTDSGGIDCSYFGFNPGPVGCGANCSFDVTTCFNYGFCDDSIFDPGYEPCDGTALESWDGTCVRCSSADMWTVVDATPVKLTYRAMYITGDGTMYVAGTAAGSYVPGTARGQLDYIVDTYSPQGRLIRSIQWGTQYSETPEYIEKDGSQLLVLGRDITHTTITMYRLTEDGSVLASATYQPMGHSGSFFEAKHGPGDLIYMAGQYYTQGSDGAISTPFFAIIDPHTLQVVNEWSVQPSSGEVDLYCMEVDGAGNIYAGGRTNGSVTSSDTLTGNLDAVIMKFDTSAGQMVWSRQWGVSGTNSGISDLALENGLLYAGGQKYKPYVGVFDPSTGDEISSFTIPIQWTVRAMATASDGLYILIPGISTSVEHGVAGESDFLIRKYAYSDLMSADPQPLWSFQSTSPESLQIDYCHQMLLYGRSLLVAATNNVRNRADLSQVKGILYYVWPEI